jgi:thiol-disulfide isomerase/thioredoxin
MKRSAFFIAVVAASFSMAIAIAADDFESRIVAASRATKIAMAKGDKEYFAVMAAQGRGLLKDFPDKEEPYQMVTTAADFSPPDTARALVKLVLDSKKAPEEYRSRAKGIARRLEMVGKPLKIKFKSIDGREVDLAAMKGKVVLIDFWASWCAPCVAEAPRIREAYEKLHSKGFEVIGINMDEDKAAFEDVVKSKKLEWPHYFDGNGRQNYFAQQFGITLLPAMWLVDKKGKLVDVAALDAWPEKVEKLLAE